jgi:hypothetical protein
MVRSRHGPLERGTGFTWCMLGAGTALLFSSALGGENSIGL